MMMGNQLISRRNQPRNKDVSKKGKHKSGCWKRVAFSASTLQWKCRPRLKPYAEPRMFDRRRRCHRDSHQVNDGCNSVINLIADTTLI